MIVRKSIMPYKLLRQALYALPPETAHRFALAALRVAQAVWAPLAKHPPAQSGQGVECFGLSFPSPVGLAAGFDKNGDYIDALGSLGFGFLEIGTLTPKPQSGNPKPRLFRLPMADALINQMGSPNKGIGHAVEKMKRRRFRGIVGANIGKNAATPLDRAAIDYVAGYRAVRAHADYVAINVSSPNTVGLRELQGEIQLRRILEDLLDERDRSAERSPPILVKLSPDLSATELESIARVIADCAIDGIIATNTTVSREGLPRCPPKMRSGGLSGRPLHRRSVAVIRMLRERLGMRIGIIGVGGIMSADDAVETMDAGANLVQIYAGLVYRGPRLISEIATAVNRRIGDRRGTRGSC